MTAPVSINIIQERVLNSHQNHRQLSIHESEMLVLDLIELLCDTCCQDENTLRYLAKLITPSNYHELIIERNLVHKCGYPLCNRSPERNRDPYSVNSKTNKFLNDNNPYDYLSKFCSRDHYKCSQFYQIQLSDDELFSRTAIHLITDTLNNNKNTNEQYNVILFEDLAKEKASDVTDDDIKFVISNLKRLDIYDGENPQEEKQLEKELSKWLSDIKIVENEKPHILGDLLKE